MKNVLIIGGAGTWSSQAYIPSIVKSDKYVRLVAIMDCVNPYYSSKTIKYYDYFKSSQVEWVKTSNNCDNLLLQECIQKNDIDIVIISTPPKYHLDYTLGALKCGVDVMCDKPLISTRAQSSLLESAYQNVQKHNVLLKALNESYNKKENRRCFVLTPLRRKVQETYTNIYDTLGLIKNIYSQEISNINISHNDGVFRFSDEVELNCGSHSYIDGFGKLTHTGYHILDVVAGLIQFGVDVDSDIKCCCDIINCNTVKDMLDAKSCDINAKLIRNLSEKKEVSAVALDAEMDITISYKLYHNDKKFCNIIVDLIHTGMSNRTVPHYDFNRYNDEGRTNELCMHIQQGSLFSTQMILNTRSNSGGTVGNGYTFKNFHPAVAKKIGHNNFELLDFANQSRETVVDILLNIYAMISNNNLEGYYTYTDYLKQQITDELYIAALIAKTSKKSYTWNLTKIK